MPYASAVARKAVDECGACLRLFDGYDKECQVDVGGYDV